MPLRKYTKQIGLSFDLGPYVVRTLDRDGKLLREDTIGDLEDIAPYLYQVGASATLAVGTMFQVLHGDKLIGTATIEW